MPGLRLVLHARGAAAMGSRHIASALAHKRRRDTHALFAVHYEDGGSGYVRIPPDLANTDSTQAIREVCRQKAEYEWPTPFGAGRFKPEQPVTKVEGDHDVFGDGSVTILAAPGHTPGHQSLLVKLPKTGALVLSGDAVHPFQKQLGESRRSFKQHRQGSDAGVDAA